MQCGCNAHVASGFFCVKIIFDNVDFQMFLTQILYLNSKRVKIGGEQELSTSQAAKNLELTPTSISRASKQLEEMGLLHIKKEGVPQFYRFSHPITNQYPAMIELFTRKLDAIQLPEDADEQVEDPVFTSCGSTLRCNRVLFVERSGELRMLARLSTKGAEPKREQV